MLEKLGNRAIIVPFLLPVLMFCILGLAITPILRAQMNDVPFAVVTLDEGSDLPIGTVNIGDELVSRLLNGEGLGDIGSSNDRPGESSNSLGNVSIAWTQLGSEDELRDALAANEFYGGIVVPADFTAQQMRSATGLGGAPTLKVLLNSAKNPSLAQQMGPNLKSLMLQAGISVEVEDVNAADIGGGSMAPMMVVQMIAMPLFIMTLIASILLSVLLWPRNGASRRKRLTALVKQLVAGAFLSALVATLGLGIDAWFGGLNLPMERLFPFVWMAVGAMMVCLVGLCNLVLPLGALIGVTTFALGMSCAMLAFEMLPAFWQEWVYPWVPQHFLGDGVRAIVYLGAEPFSTGFGYWITLYDIGTVTFVLALLVPAGKTAESSEVHRAHRLEKANARKGRRGKRARQAEDEALEPTAISDERGMA